MATKKKVSKNKKNSKEYIDDFGPSTVKDEVILSVKNLKTNFTTKWGTVKAVDGVKTARWNVVNGKMKIKFNPEKTNLDQIHKAIIHVGYDTELYNASDESYNKLHYCCKYERK